MDNNDKANYLKNVLHLLKISNYYISDEDILTAKGKYEAPTSLKELIPNVKRNLIKI